MLKEVSRFVSAWTSPLPRKNSADTKGPGGWRDGWKELKDAKVHDFEICLEHLALQKIQGALPRVGKP